MGVLRVVTDWGTEFFGRTETHDYQLFLAFNDIEHTKTLVRHPQTMAFTSDFKIRSSQEFYKVVLRRKIYGSIDELRADPRRVNHLLQQRPNPSGKDVVRPPPDANTG